MGNWISPSYNVASLWVYHFSRNQVYPSGCCLCQQFWQQRMSLVLGVYVCLSASQVYARLKSVCQCLWLIRWVCWVCVLCVCVSVSVCPCICVSVSDMCVGSGLQSCWHCGLALLSLVGRSCRLHNRSAGKAPSHGCLSCGGAYTPGPLSARAYRCETKSAWRSTDPQSNLQISGRYPLPCLEKMGTDRWKCVKLNQPHWKHLELLLQPIKDWLFFTGNSPFTAWGWWPWGVGGFLVWCSMVLLCLCQPVMMDASVPSMSLAWQTPRKAKRKKWI